MTLNSHGYPLSFSFSLLVYFWVRLRQRTLKDITVDFEQHDCVEQLASTIFDESRAMFEMCESTVSSSLSSLAHINKSYRCYQVSRRHCNEQQRDEHDLLYS